MKMLKINIFVLLFILCSCSTQEDYPIEKQWNVLLQDEGCYGGLWNYQGFKPEGSILKEKNWSKFIDKPNPETIPFLINKLDSKIETKIHLCTWKDATEGELALILIEYIILKLII